MKTGRCCWLPSDKCGPSPRQPHPPRSDGADRVRRATQILTYVCAAQPNNPASLRATALPVPPADRCDSPSPPRAAPRLATITRHPPRVHLHTPPPLQPVEGGRARRGAPSLPCMRISYLLPPSASAHSRALCLLFSSRTECAKGCSHVVKRRVAGRRPKRNPWSAILNHTAPDGAEERQSRALTSHFARAGYPVLPPGSPACASATRRAPASTFLRRSVRLPPKPRPSLNHFPAPASPQLLRCAESRTPNDKSRVPRPLHPSQPPLPPPLTPATIQKPNNSLDTP